MKLIIKILRIIILIICLGLIAFSLTKIIPWCIDNFNTSNEINNAKSKIKISRKKPTKIEIYDENSKYINEKFLSLDFTKLLKENNEVVGWIKVKGTKINYPFVKHNDNNYYLYHSLNKKYNEAGWLFLDYRNNLEQDQNSIIYAHGRVDGTMFGSLKDTLTKKWQNKKKNYVVKISTPKNNYIYEIFSIYHIKTTDDYLQINFNDSNDYNMFISKIKTRSAYNFNTNISSDSKILTLSTCYNDADKMVLHAKLIKKEIR